MKFLKTLDAVRAAQVLFFLDAAIWVALGITSLLHLSRGPVSVMMALVIAILMFGNAGAMVVSGVGLGTKRRRFFYLALAVLLVNIVLTFTDQVGLLDILTFVLDLVLLVLLIVTGKRYIHRDAQGQTKRRSASSPQSEESS
jgi:FtsH-binding integral membrane protein